MSQNSYKNYLSSKPFRKSLTTALIYFVLNIIYFGSITYIIFYEHEFFHQHLILLTLLGVLVITVDSIYLFYVLYHLLKEKYGLKSFLQKTIFQFDIIKRKLFEVSKKELKKFEGGEEANKIIEVAYFDAVTGLPNRLQLEVFIESLITKHPTNGFEMAITVLDVERLTQIQRFISFPVAQVILKDIGFKLKNILPDESFIAKLDENKFAIVFYDYGCLDILFEYIKRIKKLIEGTWYVVGNEFELEATIGVVFYPLDGKTSEVLLTGAEKALMQAKVSSEVGVYFSNQDMNNKFYYSINLAKELRKAVSNKEFVLVYHPIVDLSRRKVVGAEVLLRWVNPQRGIVPAQEFIAFAEKEGMIPEIEGWVIENVAEDVKVFEEVWGEEFLVTLNVSFLNSEVVEKICKNKVFNQYREYNKIIGFEINQHDIDVNLSSCLKITEEVKKRGFKVIIDDYCSETISMDMLMYFPLDAIKVDNRCLSNIAFDSRLGKIVKGIIEIAHSLKIKVIAEGIETKYQYKIAKEIGCDLAQGYLISKPMFRNEFLEFYKAVEKGMLQLIA